MTPRGDDDSLIRGFCQWPCQRTDHTIEKCSTISGTVFYWCSRDMRSIKSVRTKPLKESKTIDEVREIGEYKRKKWGVIIDE